MHCIWFYDKIKIKAPPSGSQTCIHNWSEWQTTREASEQEDGLQERYCLKCNKRETQTIPKKNHIHEFQIEWKTDSENHWKECSCGEKSEYEKHIWNDGITTTAPSHYEDGKKLYTCIVCNYSKAEKIPKFASCESLVNITIPEGVTSIGKFAFYSCKSLKGITLPESLTEIKRCAFNSCASLLSITIPKNVTVIGDHAFDDEYNSILIVTIQASVPPMLDNSDYYGSFNLHSDRCSIYVPNDSVDAYKFAEGWKEHSECIKAIPSGINY